MKRVLNLMAGALIVAAALSLSSYSSSDEPTATTGSGGSSNSELVDLGIGIVKSNCTRTWVTKNGVAGILIKGVLPATGYRRGTSVNGRGTDGYYWSGTLDSDGTYYTYYLYFGNGYWGTSIDYRNYGFALRPVSASPSE